MGDVWESDGVVVETWESSTEPGVTFTTVIREGDIVTGGSGGDLSDATPQDLGTAAAGVSDEASRADHVHDMPTATDVGADPSGTAATAVTVHTADTTAVHGIADTSALVVTSDARLSDARTPTAHTHPAADIAVDASGFNGNLTTSDDTVQEIAQKVDDLVIPAAGIADPGGANDDFLQRKSGAWTYRTVAQVKTDLSVPAAPFVLETPVGQYVGPSAPNTAISNQTDLYLSAGGRGTACLLYLAAGTYDRIGVWLQSAGAAIIRIGLYAAGSEGLPAARVLDAGTIDVSGSTGLREITISQTVTAGWYWASVSADSYTSTFSLYGLNNALAPFIAGGVHNSSAAIKQKPGVASTGFGTSGIPDPFPTPTWSPDGAPKVILRRSA